jgi:hypothetical protein
LAPPETVQLHPLVLELTAPGPPPLLPLYCQQLQVIPGTPTALSQSSEPLPQAPRSVQLEVGLCVRQAFFASVLTV